MKKLLGVLVLLGAFHITTVHAEEPQAAPAIEAPVELSGSEQAVMKLQEAEKKIPMELPTMMGMILMLVSEIAMRVYPTAKPKSWLLLLALGLDAIAGICKKLSGLANNVGKELKQ